MPLKIDPLGDIFVVSVHDEEEPIHFSIPSVTPSRYEIPGVNAPNEVFQACRFSFPDRNPIQYAHRRTKNNRPYVLIRIVEPKTFMLGTESQKLDEYGQKLSPDIQRVPVPVRMELIANEIERQCGKMGLKAIEGEVTEEILNEIEKRSVEFMRATVADTNRLAKRSSLNVTPQARRRAARLYKMGLLNPMPEWAEINPEAREGVGLQMFNCENCSKLLRKGVVKCDACGAIYDWKRAVELGMVKPTDVPPSKRGDAGLEMDALELGAAARKAGIVPGVPGAKAAHDTRDSQAPSPAPQEDPNEEGDDASDDSNPVAAATIEDEAISSLS